MEGLWSLASVLTANQVSAAMLSRLEKHDQPLLDQWCQGAGTSYTRERLMQVVNVWGHAEDFVLYRRMCCIFVSVFQSYAAKTPIRSLFPNVTSPTWYQVLQEWKKKGVCRLSEQPALPPNRTTCVERCVSLGNMSAHLIQFVEAIRARFWFAPRKQASGTIMWSFGIAVVRLHDGKNNYS